MRWHTDRRTGLLVPEHDLAGKLYSPANQLQGVYKPAAVAAPTYTTWNPADKDSRITLTGSDLVATGPVSYTPAYYPGVRSIIGKSSGKWYWECVPTGSATCVIGIGSATQTLAMGANLGGGEPPTLEGLRAYFTDGSKYYPYTAYGASYVSGSVLGFKLDMDGGTLECLKNNVSQGTLVSGLTGTMYAYTAVSSNNSPANVVTANFGASAFVYSVPAGYNSGLYT